MKKDKIFILLFLLMLVLHLAHVLEEVWGKFFMMEAVLGMGWFLMINGILWCIPLIILCFLIKGKYYSYILAIIYSSIMLINGFAHNVLTLITGRYYKGFAGGFTGIGLVMIGIPLILILWKKIRETSHNKDTGI